MEDYELEPLQQRMRLAQMLMQQQSNPRTGWAALTGALNQYRGRKELDAASAEMKELGRQRRERDDAERSTFADLATAQPRPAMAPMIPNDDEGNAMPQVGGESAPEFQQRRQQLAKQLLMSRNPQMQQFGMQAMAPQKKDLLTLKEGEQAFERDPMTGALKSVAGAPKKEKQDLDALIILGPDGKPMINPLAIEAKERIAKAGRAPQAPRAPIWDSERGVMIDPNNGQAMPVTMGGKPIGGKQSGGKPLPASTVNSIADAAAQAQDMQRLFGTFKDEYAGQPILGPARNLAGRTFGDESGQAQWWQDYQNQKNIIRNKLFGAALTQTEKAEFDKAQIGPGMNSKEIRANLTRQEMAARRAVEKLAKAFSAGGYSQQQIDELTNGVTGMGGAPSGIDALLKKYGG